MNNYIITGFFLFALCSCKSEFQSFNERALSYANDKRIDEDEYKSLIDEVSGTQEKGFKQFKGQNDKIDDEKVRSYLVKLFTAKKLVLTEQDIWQPSKNLKQDKFNVNVFLENSVSMDGYVNGITEFETAIYNLLSDIKISGLCDSLNLNYINKKPIPFGKRNALAADIEDFIEKLNPSEFRVRGGTRGNTDLKNILKTVLQSVDNNNLAVLISDFVFSPGMHMDAEEYLNSQSIGIKVDFAEKIESLDMSAVILQLFSSFRGSYYDKTNLAHEYNGKRPYYIWLIGSNIQIKSILNSKILENIKGGYTHKLVFHSVQETDEPNFKILNNPKIGRFSSKELNNKIISEASVAKNERERGLFGFNVAVNFSTSLHDREYFSDTTNYAINDNSYRLEVETISDNNDPSLIGYSHILHLKTANLRERNLKIDVVSKIPEWVNSSSSLNDKNFKNDPSEQTKTFGFNFLVEGVNDAFYKKSMTKPIYSINIPIKK